MQPSSTSSAASPTNRPTTPPRRRPMARSVPISRVRSTTAMPIELATLITTTVITMLKMKPKIMSNMPCTWL